MKHAQKHKLLMGLGAVWLALVAAGLGLLWRHAISPGAAGPATLSWPASTALALHRDRFTLVMFAHPRCPCTRASIGELDRLMADCAGRIDAHGVFFRPASADPGWDESDLPFSAARIPGVRTHWDVQGVEAVRFQAETSGDTLLFDPSGHLLFRGGITSARGHSGDNTGRDAIVKLVGGGQSKPSFTPVYGCSITDPRNQCKTSN